MIAGQLGPIRGVVGHWGESFNYTTPRAGSGGFRLRGAERTMETLDLYQACWRG